MARGCAWPWRAWLEARGLRARGIATLTWAPPRAPAAAQILAMRLAPGAADELLQSRCHLGARSLDLPHHEGVAVRNLGELLEQRTVEPRLGEELHALPWQHAQAQLDHVRQPLVANEGLDLLHKLRAHLAGAEPQLRL